VDGRDRLPYAPFDARDRHDRVWQSRVYADPRIPDPPRKRVRRYVPWVSRLGLGRRARLDDEQER
jgi:hypothetical protein